MASRRSEEFRREAVRIALTGGPTRTRIAAGAGVVLDRVELGGFVDTDVRAVVNGGRMNISLLGMTYLDRFRSFSVEGDRLLLSR